MLNTGKIFCRKSGSKFLGIKQIVFSRESSRPRVINGKGVLISSIFIPSMSLMYQSHFLRVRLASRRAESGELKLSGYCFRGLVRREVACLQSEEMGNLVELNRERSMEFRSQVSIVFSLACIFLNSVAKAFDRGVLRRGFSHTTGNWLAQFVCDRIAVSTLSVLHLFFATSPVVLAKGFPKIVRGRFFASGEEYW